MTSRKVKYAGFYTCNMQAVRVTPFFDTAQEAADYAEANNKDYDVIRPVANWKEM
jgi:hypothetical protein